MTAIKYSLTKNNIDNKNSNSYRAIVIHNGVVNEEELRRRIAIRGNKNASDIASIMILLGEVVSECITRGEVISSDIFSTNYSIKGIFEGELDSYDSSRHELKVNLNGGKTLTQSLASLGLEKGDIKYKAPSLSDFVNEDTKEHMGAVTVNAAASIYGRQLMVDMKNAESGIFFSPSNGDQALKVNNIISNTSNRLIFKIPEVDAGEYTISVVTVLSGTEGNAKLGKGELLGSITVTQV